MMVGTIRGISIRLRTLSDSLEPIRQQPIAHKVPSVTAITVDEQAMKKLFPRLASHLGLVSKLAKWAKEIPSCGRDR